MVFAAFGFGLNPFQRLRRKQTHFVRLPGRLTDSNDAKIAQSGGARFKMNRQRRITALDATRGEAFRTNMDRPGCEAALRTHRNAHWSQTRKSSSRMELSL